MITRILAVLFFALALVAGYLFYDQSFKWRTCFNEAGRCFDAATGTVYTQQSGIAWLGLTVLFLAIAIYLARRAVTPRR